VCEHRLDEFAATPSGQLTVSDFRELWLEDAADPPAFAKTRKRSHWELGEDEEEEDLVNEEIIRRGEVGTSKISLAGVKEGTEEEEPGHLETETTSGSLMAPGKIVPAGVTEALNGNSNGSDGQDKEIFKEEGEEEEGDGQEEEEEEEAEGEEGEEVEDDAIEEEMEEEMDAAMEDPLIQEEQARLDGKVFIRVFFRQYHSWRKNLQRKLTSGATLLSLPDY